MKLLFPILSTAVLLTSCGNNTPKPEKMSVAPLELIQEDGVFTLRNDNPNEWFSAQDTFAPNSKTEVAEASLTLFSTSGDTAVVQAKHIQMDGPVNFRDLGGVFTADGKQVAHGRIFRSDKLSELSTADIELLNEKSLKTVIDFRNEHEVTDEPDILDSAWTYVHLPIGDFDPDQFWEVFSEIKDDEASIDSLMLSMYKTFPVDFAGKYKTFFERVAQTDGPLVYHCTAGKDRTGIATALFYHTLGVDMENIVNDYVNSNHYRHAHNAKYVKMLQLKGVSPEISQIILGVCAQYLIQIFANIEAQYGSVDAYLATELGVNDSIQSLLIDKYTY